MLTAAVRASAAGVCALLSQSGCAAAPAPLGTIDIIEERVYFGEIDEDQLKIGISEAEPSEIEVYFYPCGEEQCVSVDFTGALELLSIELEGPDTAWAEGVTIDGDDVSCMLEFRGWSFWVEGAFEANDTALGLDMHLSLGSLGTSWLGYIALDEEPLEEDPG